VSELGNKLREARIRRSLTIKDVEDVTKIRSKYLEALEEDDFEVLPGPTYVKAFLRTYATFLRLDQNALVDQYRREYEPREEEPVAHRGEITQRSQSRTSAERKNKRVRRNHRGYALVGVVAVVVVVLLFWFGSGRGRDAATIDASSISSSTTSTSLSAVNSTTTVPAVGGSTSTTASTDSTTGGTESTTVSGTGTTVGGNVIVVLTVTQDSCWLVVRENSESGAEIYAGTLSAGGQQTFDSSKRYWMLVGKPEVLALSVNGAPYTLAAPAGSFVVTGAGIERSP
jgi:cytoskeletal protein RodZ